MPLLWPDALVVVVAPDAAHLQLLVANMAKLPILPVPVALAATPGRIALADLGEGPWAFRTQEVGGCVDGAPVVS